MKKNRGRSSNTLISTPLITGFPNITRPFVIFIIWIFTISFMLGCSNSDEKEQMNNPEKSIVKIDINGHNFDVPLNYMYGETIEKWGNWPKAKKDRIKVDNLSLSMLLPDMRPYTTRKRMYAGRFLVMVSASKY